MKLDRFFATSGSRVSITPFRRIHHCFAPRQMPFEFRTVRTTNTVGSDTIALAANRTSQQESQDLRVGITHATPKRNSGTKYGQAEVTL
jgi:hypothetical protein